MKKLLIAVSAAACALGAFAALTKDKDSKVTFEEAGYTLNNPLVLANDDDGNPAADSGAGQWYSASPTGVDATVTAYAAPAEGKYLNIESTGKPLYRLINGMATPDVGTATPETMGTVYIDTMVQFTAGDPDMTSDEAGAKLALWVCGNDPEGDPATTTNFMVKAGCFDENGFTNAIYTMAAPTGVTFKKDAWYRLTVKTMKDVYTGEDNTLYHGFVVFVDGQMLKPQNYSLPEGVSVAAKFKDGLVLSMIEDNPLLRAVGFSGTGAIDDVTFTLNAPEFAADAQTVTLTWTAGVTELVYGNWSTNVTEAGSATVPFVADEEVIVTYDENYMAGTAKGALAVGDTYEVVAVPVVATVDGTTYATLEAAIAAANGKTVVLKAGYNAGLTEQGVPLQLSINGTMVLDLAGQTLTDGAMEIDGEVYPIPVITLSQGASLTITNSTVEIGYVRGTIENTQGTLVLAGGKFLTTGLPGGYQIGDGLEAQELTGADAGYTQIVVATDEPEPTVITITFVNGDTSESVVAGADGKVAAPTDPTEDGKVFVGWYNGEAKFDASTTFTGDATFTAKWADVAAAEDGDATYDDEASADAVIANGTKAPEGVTGDAEATYKGYFTGTKTSSEVGGKTVYTVTFVLTAQGEKAVKDAMAESAASIPVANVAAGTATATDITGATPGFYYSIEVADNLSFTKSVEGTRKLATGNSVSGLEIPTVSSDGKARFFRVKANVKGK